MTCLKGKTEDDPEVDPHRDSVLDVNASREITFTRRIFMLRFVLRVHIRHGCSLSI